MGLSGAAATSAGLAALGGGAVASGGLGMAGGTMLIAGSGGLAGAAGATGALALLPEQIAVEGRKLVALIRLLKLGNHGATVLRYREAIEAETNALQRRLALTKKKDRRRALEALLAPLEEALKETE